jgi:hypothetical protein
MKERGMTQTAGTCMRLRDLSARTLLALVHTPNLAPEFSRDGLREYLLKTFSHKQQNDDGDHNDDNDDDKSTRCIPSRFCQSLDVFNSRSSLSPLKSLGRTSCPTSMLWFI